MLSENGRDQLPADVLKLGHQGSRNSTTPEFLAAVKPRFAVISVGEDNPYGHPNAELLERHANGGARVLRTDRYGAVHILMDGKGLPSAAFFPACRLAAINYNERKRHITVKTSISNRKPIAARCSRFFLYCAKENAAAAACGSFAGVRRGRNKGTACAYSRKASP